MAINGYLNNSFTVASIMNGFRSPALKPAINERFVYRDRSFAIKIKLEIVCLCLLNKL